MANDDRYQGGVEMRRTVLGAEHVERSLSNSSSFARPIQELVTEYCWGAVWTRPGLTLRDRSLLNMAMLTALNRPEELELHVRGALNNGCTEQEIQEVLLQTAVYCGVPAAISAFRIAQRVVERAAVLRREWPSRHWPVPEGRGLNGAAVLIVFRLEQRVDAWLAVRGRVEVGRPSWCPACGCARLTFDGWRPRQTRHGLVMIQRVLCAAADGHVGGLDKSHSMVPDVLVTGRVDLVSVIGWALERKAAGFGFRRIAAELGVPAETVRGWLRRAAGWGMTVAGWLLVAAAAADPAGRDPPADGPVVTLVRAAGLAAQAYARLSGEPVDVWRHAVVVCGSRLLG